MATPIKPESILEKPIEVDVTFDDKLQELIKMIKEIENGSDVTGYDG